jgi:hypothetical protein
MNYIIILLVASIALYMDGLYEVPTGNTRHSIDPDAGFLSSLCNDATENNPVR